MLNFILIVLSSFLFTFIASLLLVAFILKKIKRKIPSLVKGIRNIARLKYDRERGLTHLEEWVNRELPKSSLKEWAQVADFLKSQSINWEFRELAPIPPKWWKFWKRSRRFPDSLSLGFRWIEEGRNYRPIRVKLIDVKGFQEEDDFLGNLWD
jgi:hypothetical protein